jgi:hypothetical protein
MENFKLRNLNSTGNIRRKEWASLCLGLHGGLLDFGVDVFFLLKSLLPSDDLSGALDEDVDEVDFGLAETVGVRDVPSTTGGGRVDSSGSTSLKRKFANVDKLSNLPGVPSFRERS